MNFQKRILIIVLSFEFDEGYYFISSLTLYNYIK